MSKNRDRELGMTCPITRRDFLNGVAIAAGGVMTLPAWMEAMADAEFAPEKARGITRPRSRACAAIMMALTPTLIAFAMASLGTRWAPRKNGRNLRPGGRGRRH